jgi:hypothetical protein
VDFRSEYAAHGESTGANGDEPPFTPNPAPQMDVTFVTPWEPGTTSVALLNQNQVLDERSVSAHAPQVTVTDPSAAASWPAGTTQTLRWQGADADGDTLSYAVFYSHDAGATWDLLADALSETSFALEVDSLAGGSDTRFRVVATDGVNIAVDQTDAPITIPNKLPAAVILNPANGSTYLLGALVLMEGSGTDLEDGQLVDAALAWSSDRAGALGSGATLALNTLAPGRHIITLTATDAQGAASTSSVSIFIGNQTLLPAIQR